MLIYKCDDLTNSPGANSSDVCDEVHEEARRCTRNLLIGGWAVGAGVRHNYICNAYLVILCVYVCVWECMYCGGVCVCVCVYMHVMGMHACVCVLSI